MELASSGEIPASLAHDLACKLLPVSAVLEKYKLDSARLKTIIATSQFKVLYDEAKARWDKDTNTEDRIRSKSAMLVEDSLLEVYSILHHQDTSNSSKLESFKQLTTVADLGPKRAKDGEKSSHRTTITINVPSLDGAPRRELSISGETIEHEEM